jgi:branched-chain amino acid transport system substrate-binding protein
MVKRALLIGVSEYRSGLENLPAAAKDVAAMQRVLANTGLGNFDDVKIVINPDLATMQLEIGLLFRDREKNDLVLLFFSGHGMKDEAGKLYFATCTTDKSSFKETSVPARFVQESMAESRSRQQILILDCCFSGAFADGLSVKDNGSVNLTEEFPTLGGKDRVVLTSSTATQPSFEKAGADLSVYTQYIVQGIESGEADMDQDGVIAVEELHDYARRQVMTTSTNMRPESYAVREGHKIVVAKAPSRNPQIIYRRDVERMIGCGQISVQGRKSRFAREFLQASGQNLQIPKDKMATIETEVIQPYQCKQKQLEKYRQVAAKLVKRSRSQNSEVRSALSRLQYILGLTYDDIVQLEQEVSHSYGDHHVRGWMVGLLAMVTIAGVGSIKLPGREGSFFQEWGTQLQKISTDFALQQLIQSKGALTPKQQSQLRAFSEKRGPLPPSNQPSVCESPAPQTKKPNLKKLKSSQKAVTGQKVKSHE